MTSRPGAARQARPARQAAPPAFDAVILAGGRGTRLGGADKPGLHVGSSTLAAIAVTAAVAAGTQSVILVGPARPELLPLAAGQPGGLIVVSEEPPASGPVPALRCGLAQVRAPWAAVLAADLPFLQGEHLESLRARAAAPARAAGAVLVDDAGRPQWLTGWWRTDTLRSALQGYSGTSLRGLMEPLHPRLVCCDIAAGQPPPWLDCDSPDDLELARRMHARQMQARQKR